MKLSHVVIASVLGMGASSIGVSWAVPRAEPVVAPTAAIAPPAVPPPPVAVASAPAIASSFVAEAALRMEARMGHAALPSAAPGETFVLVEVAANATNGEGPRAPADVAIVLDRSGSMRGRKLDNALAAVRNMVAQLRPDDTLSLVSYADRAEALVSPTSIRRLDRLALSRALDRVRTRGHTCISCGIDMARRMLDSGRTSRILLLSDGQANRGVMDDAGLRSLAGLARSEGISIATIGVDVDYDERTMLALAESSNGRHYFVEDSAALADVFEQERTALAQTVADRADLQVRLADGVELLEVVDRTHTRDGGLVTIPLGAFATGTERTALLRVRIAPGVDVHEVAQLKLAYRDVAADRGDELSGALAVRFDDVLAAAAPLDPAVDARLGRKDTFDALLDANAAFARGDVVAAERTLDVARRAIRSRKQKSAGNSDEAEQDFDRQLEALSTASGGFRDASKNVKPAAAPKQRAGKVITRHNAAVADPFSD